MTTFEKTTRIIIGILVILTGLFLLNGIGGDELGIALAVAGFFPLLTALFNYCPLYSLTGAQVKKER